VPADLFGQRRPELLDPTQDGPSAHVDTAVGQDARDALGRGTELQVRAHGQQDDVAREAMAGHQARRLAPRVSATGATGTDGAAALIATIASQVPR
jgi:hypothetical protein